MGAVFNNGGVVSGRADDDMAFQAAAVVADAAGERGDGGVALAVAEGHGMRDILAGLQVAAIVDGVPQEGVDDVGVGGFEALPRAHGGSLAWAVPCRFLKIETGTGCRKPVNFGVMGWVTLGIFSGFKRILVQKIMGMRMDSR